MLWGFPPIDAPSIAPKARKDWVGMGLWGYKVIQLAYETKTGDGAKQGRRPDTRARRPRHGNKRNRDGSSDPLISHHGRQNDREFET